MFMYNVFIVKIEFQTCFFFFLPPKPFFQCMHPFFFLPRPTLETCSCLLTPSSPLTSTQRSSDRDTRAKSSRETHREQTLPTLHPIHYSAYHTCQLSVRSRHVSLTFFVTGDCFCRSLPQPCVCHSRRCFQSVSSLHTGAVHRHKVLTGPFVQTTTLLHCPLRTLLNISILTCTVTMLAC